MGTKVQVQIRYCFCCSLWISALLIAIYTFLFYLLLICLAAWAVADTEGSDYHYNECYQQANDTFSCKDKYPIGTIGESSVIVCDASSYHCSLGLYTGELKFDTSPRQPILIINLIIYIALLVCALLIVLSLITRFEWLLLPWLGFMCLDILRGIISCIMIFVLSLGDLTRIAVGIFFLGIQVFHMSLVLVIIAKFQQMREKKKPPKPAENVYLADGSNIYPTMPASQYAYSTSPPARREGYYQPNQYNTYAGKEGSAYRYPQQDNMSQYSGRGGDYYGYR